MCLWKQEISFQRLVYLYRICDLETTTPWSTLFQGVPPPSVYCNNWKWERPGNKAMSACMTLCVLRKRWRQLFYLQKSARPLTIALWFMITIKIVLWKKFFFWHITSFCSTVLTNGYHCQKSWSTPGFYTMPRDFLRVHHSPHLPQVEAPVHVPALRNLALDSDSFITIPICLFVCLFVCLFNTQLLCLCITEQTWRFHSQASLGTCLYVGTQYAGLLCEAVSTK